ncbi:MAG: putative endonuclease, partial [Frankiales bacterium]|nr:putative endonuclease [Frankiales bacterium]
PFTGPATRSQIQTLHCDAQLERITLDHTGQALSLTTGTDQITTAQRRAVTARDRCCTTKGCNRPPAFCDIHHLRARADGGPTTIDNLVLLCRRHHVQWHRQHLDHTDLRTPWTRLPQPRAPAHE